MKEVTPRPRNSPHCRVSLKRMSFTPTCNACNTGVLFYLLTGIHVKALLFAAKQLFRTLAATMMILSSFNRLALLITLCFAPALARVTFEETLHTGAEGLYSLLTLPKYWRTVLNFMPSLMCLALNRVEVPI